MTLSVSALAAFASVCASASASALSGGTLDLVDSNGTVLASVGVGTPTASGAVTTMGGFPKSTSAAASGTAASGRYRTASGGDWVTGMSVGVAGSGAQIIVPSPVISAGQPVTVNSAVLIHSAASGG